MAERLDDEAFEHVIRNAPLCSIDFVLGDASGSVLLGLRNHEPAKDFYFVPGGRIRKGERISEAFGRILFEETSIRSDIGTAKFLGVFEHFYDTNRFGGGGYGTHYICQAFALEFATRPDIAGDLQHSRFVWAAPQELHASKVHPYSLAYLGGGKSGKIVDHV